MGAKAILMVMMVAGAAAVETAGAEIPESARISARRLRVLELTGDEAMFYPTDVAVDSSGRAYVVDGTRDRLVRFGKDGKDATTIDQLGGESLARPIGICVADDGALWVADNGHRRVLVFHPENQKVETITLPDGADGAAPDPVDVAVTPDSDRAYIVDNDNHRLLIRDRKGTITQMGSKGRALGQFDYPFTVALGPNGYVHICEAIGARVQLLSPDNRWAGPVGRWGVELGQLYRPKGVAVDSHGRIYVSDSTLKVVQVFGIRGNLLGILTDEAGRPIRFRYPMGMSFDAAGLLYIVEMRANRVAVLDVDGAKPGGQDGKNEP